MIEVVSSARAVLALDPSNGEACRLLAARMWNQAYIGPIPWDRANAEDGVMSFVERGVVAEPLGRPQDDQQATIDPHILPRELCAYRRNIRGTPGELGRGMLRGI